ncbi:LlaJI family restriction endonuclease [Paenibacillus sp. KR2-11]|uniref:LlaJI family restriction endonuclease n=1 Tax=Paenibacillus sp. KR2-11 TaxID=3385500 RepID=UPI0038FC561D
MKMVSKYIREQKLYTKKELKTIFCFSTEEVVEFIKQLKALSILKTVRNSATQQEILDLDEESNFLVIDDESKSDDCLYFFSYVGVITIYSRIIKCYPKYLLSETTPMEEMKQILKVISRYGSKKQIINLANGDAEDSRLNILSVILFLLNDYNEFGIYNNTKDIVEVNGEGEILWDKTINENHPFISKARPYYTELYTMKALDDDTDFFKQLHECVLTECSKQLDESELLHLFDLPAVNLSDNVLADFGDLDYILYRLQSQLNIEFNTRKQIVLKTLYAYISHSNTQKDDFGISMYGTNSFNLVWENVCSEVFNNKLQTPLGQLKLPVPLHNGYQPSDKLINIIKKPLWTGNKAGGGTFEKPAKETLIPDLITIMEQDGSIQFIILDAKYYNIQLDEEKVLKGYPGINDVTKQYLYQLSYKDFLHDHEINNVKNCFLMPTEFNEVVDKGMVKMDMLSSLGLKDIQIRQLPAKTMYSYYLKRMSMDVSVLRL